MSAPAKSKITSAQQCAGAVATPPPFERETSVPETAVALPPPQTPILDRAALQRLTLALADHIGPVAGVLVSRAAKTASSWEHLCQTAASELPEKDRPAFLHALLPQG